MKCHERRQNFARMQFECNPIIVQKEDPKFKIVQAS